MEEDALKSNNKLFETGNNDNNDFSASKKRPELEILSERVEDDNDILDGYLAYDISVFQGMIENNLEFQIDGFSDGFSSESDEPQFTESPKPQSQNPVATVHQPASFNLSEFSTQQEMKRSGNDFHKQNLPNYPQPIIEGDEIDPDIDIDIKQVDENLDNNLENENDDDDDDLNIFDSIDDNFNDDNVEPYQILIRYPNEDYKVSIFCPKHSDYGVNKKSQQNTLQNSELLSEPKEMDEFYSYLRKLGIQREFNLITINDSIREDQLITINQISRKFEEVGIMRDLQQKWLEVSPTFTFSGRLQTFAVQLERFMDMVKYIFEYSAGKASGRRFLHGRNGFYFTANDATSKQNNKPQQNNFNQTQPKNLINEQQIMNYAEQTIESASFSVIFFKAIELYKLFQHFLHIRKESDKYQYIKSCIQQIKSRYKVYKLIKKKVKIVKRNMKSAHTPAPYTPAQIPSPEHPQQNAEFFEFMPSNVKMIGLSLIFGQLTKQVNLDGSRSNSTQCNLEHSRSSNQVIRTLHNIEPHQPQNTNVIYHQKYKSRQQSLHWKYETNKYLSFKTNEENDYF